MMNKEEKRKWNRQYYQDNKEKIALRHKKNHEENRERNNLRTREYYQAHKEKQKIYHKGNTVKRKAYDKKYYQANKESIIAKNIPRTAKKYGLTTDEYNQMFIDSDNRCSICKMEEENRTLSVDHNHITGKVRGLLCRKCNVGIGALQTDENLNIIKKAIEYLERTDE